MECSEDAEGFEQSEINSDVDLEELHQVADDEHMNELHGQGSSYIKDSGSDSSNEPKFT